MRVFLDTSAFIERYISEAGTDIVLEWCDQATEIILSGIALPEIIMVLGLVLALEESKTKASFKLVPIFLTSFIRTVLDEVEFGTMVTARL